VTEKKDIRVAMQHEHYLRRGPELKHLSPYEWTAMIKVVKRRDEKESKTRQRNAAFRAVPKVFVKEGAPEHQPQKSDS
jgi:hypothetical protein